MWNCELTIAFLTESIQSSLSVSSLVKRSSTHIPSPLCMCHLSTSPTRLTLSWSPARTRETVHFCECKMNLNGKNIPTGTLRWESKQKLPKTWMKLPNLNAIQKHLFIETKSRPGSRTISIQAFKVGRGISRKEVQASSVARCEARGGVSGRAGRKKRHRAVRAISQSWGRVTSGHTLNSHFLNFPLSWGYLLIFLSFFLHLIIANISHDLKLILLP